MAEAEAVEPTYEASATTTVRYPVMRHSWNQLTFLHWSFEPDDVQRLLPDGLAVHTFDGKAWVGLVPFELGVGFPHLPPLPWLLRFPETNVRTYVKDKTGRTGIWFFSLDADRLIPVVTAKVSYRLPYLWSAMTIRQDGDLIHYKSERRWPEPTPAVTDVTIRIGERFAPEELQSFDHFLTARWTLFSAHKRGIHYANAVHDPWPLQRAEVMHLEQNVFEAAGLPTPVGEPIAHYSPKVVVNIGLPHRIK